MGALAKAGMGCHPRGPLQERDLGHLSAWEALGADLLAQVQMRM